MNREAKGKTLTLYCASSPSQAKKQAHEVGATPECSPFTKARLNSVIGALAERDSVVLTLTPEMLRKVVHEDAGQNGTWKSLLEKLEEHEFKTIVIEIDEVHKHYQKAHFPSCPC